MPIENWLAFTAAAAILLAIPGPTVLLVISYALGHGRKPAAAIVAGVALGDLTAMTASMAGLGAVLATSCVSCSRRCDWVGGAYLVYRVGGEVVGGRRCRRRVSGCGSCDRAWAHLWAALMR